MKILLCTPYNLGHQVVKGGIVVWAQNIIGYYQQQTTRKIELMTVII
jgi:hypothetical protein